ncbi:MAG: GNAT family N-acetyltransferase [Chitinispirillia bacterium]|nr:GNAT family N-acetyltransferase [Chitinispirillia bacterium]MCL2268116.1 GNAT family N-acetyltransferase [Chitinispirillia bacterium]
MIPEKEQLMDISVKYVNDRYIYIGPEDDCRVIVDFMLAAGYSEEWCFGADFGPEFVSRLMGAGFLVMSADIADDGEGECWYVLLPKLHLVRSVLLFGNLHVKRSVRRFLGRYELRPDAEFERILGRCVEKHGGDWLTPPLVECIKDIRRGSVAAGRAGSGGLSPGPGVYPAAFGLYRDGALAAGDFGVVCGGVYTSYSGFYDEGHAGTVLLIRIARYLEGRGFAFWDFGMPMGYKAALGAVDVGPAEFVRLFRAGGTF